MINRSVVSDHLLTVIVRAVEHGLDLAAQGKGFIPVFLTPSGIIVLATDTMDEARSVVKQTMTSGNTEYGALVYDGILMVDNERASAIIVVAYEHGRAEPIQFAQRYRRATSGRIWRKARSLKRIGNLAFLSGDSKST